jgi:transposase
VTKWGSHGYCPPDISELIPVDHICYLMVAIVNSMDVSEAEKNYRSKFGNPVYSRRMLLRLVILAEIRPFAFYQYLVCVVE